MPKAQALSEVEKLTGGGQYFLHVGGNQWHKNRLGVLHLHAALIESGRRLKSIMVGLHLIAR